MTREELVEQIKTKRTYLCVGLDTDPALIPSHLLAGEDPVFEFNRQIIDATKDFCVAYKINTAFYEAQGIHGWISMEKTLRHIPSQHFTIADAKRGDIGNTSNQYAKAFFEKFGFDSITVAPYMGEDSIRPFLNHAGKWTIVLGLTSNPGAIDFELQTFIKTTEILEEGVHITRQENRMLYEMVMEKTARWGTEENLMFVVGATQADAFTNIRKILPNHFFLVPGVGAQGGSLEEISARAMTRDCGLLVNASRAVIYASDGKDFAEAAGRAARSYAQEMDRYLAANGM